MNPSLFALALGAFGIGVTEFTPMGMLPLIGSYLALILMPTVFLVKGGQIVDGFPGAVPEGQIREFLKQHGVEPGQRVGNFGRDREAQVPLGQRKSGVAHHSDAVAA